MLPDLVEKDSELSFESQAQTEMQAAMQKLGDIRQEYKLPKD